MRINERVRQELASLDLDTIKSIKKDYRQGTELTLRDISNKYSITYATATYVCKSFAYSNY